MCPTQFASLQPRVCEEQQAVHSLKPREKEKEEMIHM
jgi:hypothetical protein